MDEASKLASELQHKLAELDQKVWRYRQDMASEFDKYVESLLHNVPTAVSESVSRSIAASLKDYQSLYPTAAPPIESCTPATRLPNGGNKERSVSPASRQPQRDQPAAEGPRSPHARDFEFQGVFTPNYLPLLDNHHERKSRHDSTPSPSERKRKPKEMEPLHIDASTSTRTTPSPDVKRPPTPRRRNTDEISVQSDWSDGPVRRSALRRSSSSSKGLSPRRVRFEVAGVEVLPTSSPAPAPSILSEENSSNGSLLDSDDEAGSEMIEDIDEPPPKRISSSQALRALSRSPLVDDGTQWITVSAPPDGSASVATTNGFSLDSDSEDSQINDRASQVRVTSPPRDIPASKPVAVPATIADEGPETPSDDDMLDMPPLRRQSASSGSMLSPNIPPATNGSKLAPSAHLPEPARQEASDDDADAEGFEDDLFQFDDQDSRSLGHYLPEADVESEPESPTSPEEPILSHFPQSPPPRDIIKPPPAQPVPPPTTKGVVGSYKNHPFSMPIVSPEVHAQAASLGPLSSFVGSVHGRTGLDASDAQSFRASMGSFAGTPRSMSERMRLEDLMEEESRRSSMSNSAV